MTDIAVLSEREITRQNRVKNFNAQSWLRGSDQAGDDTEVTVRPRRLKPIELAFEPPKLDTPKVQNFLIEQEFEGFVLSVDEKTQTFWARLADCTGGGPDEEAEFPFAEIPVDDWPLIVENAQFSWHVGRETRDRQVRRVSDIRFRRFFRFSAAKVANAERRAGALAELLAEAHAYPPINATETGRG